MKKRRKAKKSFILLIIVIIIGMGVGGYIFYKNKKEEKRIAEVKKGWYIEVANDFVNVREEASSLSMKLGKIKKGQVYKVLDLVNKKKEKECYWYHIEYKNNLQGYVCNPKGDKSRGKYLNDFNDPNDLYTPTIKYKKKYIK